MRAYLLAVAALTLSGGAAMACSITLAEFELLNPDDTQATVEAVIGCAGVVGSERVVDGATIATLLWDGPSASGGFMTSVFADGTMVSLSQIGLQ